MLAQLDRENIVPILGYDIISKPALLRHATGSKYISRRDCRVWWAMRGELYAIFRQILDGL